VRLLAAYVLSLSRPPAAALQPATASMGAQIPEQVYAGK
jgi:hypothetical protein